MQLDAQTDGKWRVSTRPLVVVNMALTAVMNASAKFSNDGKDTEVNFLIFMRIYLRKVVIEDMAHTRLTSTKRFTNPNVNLTKVGH